MRPELGAGIGIGISIGISGQGVSRGNDYVLYDDFNIPNKLSYENKFDELPIPVFKDNFDNRRIIAPWIDNSDSGGFVTIDQQELRVDGIAGIARADSPEQIVDMHQWFSTDLELVGTAGGSGDIFLRSFPSQTILDSNTIATMPGIYSLSGKVFDTDTTIEVRILSSVGATNSLDWDNVIINTIPALDGWSPDASTGSRLSILNEQLEVKKDDASINDARGILPLNYTVDIWSRFLITRKFGDTAPGATGVAISPDNTVGNSIINTFLNQGETADLYFQATQTILNILALSGIVQDDTAFYDDIIVEEVPALTGYTAFFDAGVFIEDGQVHVIKAAATASGARLIKAFPVVAGDYYNLFVSFAQVLAGNVAAVAVSENTSTGGALALLPTSTSFIDGLASFTAVDNELNLLLVTGGDLNDESVFGNITIKGTEIENGSFDNDISGWTDSSDPGGIISWDAGTLKTDGTLGIARADSTVVTASVGESFCSKILLTAVTGNTTAFLLDMAGLTIIDSITVTTPQNITLRGNAISAAGIIVRLLSPSGVNTANWNYVIVNRV